MIIPTLLLAFFIVYKSVKTNEVYLNIAVFFWITANSLWMLMEFFNHDRNKNLSAIPFALGFLFVAIFYIKSFIQNKN